MTVVLLACSYMNQEFVRIGYYANIDYIDPELFVSLLVYSSEMRMTFLDWLPVFSRSPQAGKSTRAD